MQTFRILVFGIALLVFSVNSFAADGRKIYDSVCAGCHNIGLIGAPRLGAAADWSGRLSKGTAAIYSSALKGTPRGMPPKGGKPELSDQDVRSAVDYMLGQVGGAPKAAENKASPKSVAEAKPIR